MVFYVSTNGGQRCLKLKMDYTAEKDLAALKQLVILFIVS
jgi:hypothetical protein